MFMPSAGSLEARRWIENVLNRILEEVAKGKNGQVCVVLRRIQKYEAAVKQDTVTTEFRARDHEAKYTWPGKTADEAWRFGGVHPLTVASIDQLTRASLLCISPELHPFCNMLRCQRY